MTVSLWRGRLSILKIVLSGRKEASMPMRENRRLRANGGSVALTLPKGWLNYFGLKPGDEVEVVANGNLVIRPTRAPDADSPEEPGEKR